MALGLNILDLALKAKRSAGEVACIRKKVDELHFAIKGAFTLRQDKEKILLQNRSL